MPRFRFLLSLLIAVSSLAGCTDPPRDCSLRRVADLSVTRPHGLPLVPVVLDGHQATMIVDTGAERSLLTEDAVSRLNLPRDVGHISRTLGIGGPSTNWDVRVDALVMGGVRFPVSRLAVGHFTTSASHDDAPIGLLGADILLAFDLDIDMARNAITLYRARRCADARPPWLDEPVFAISGVVTRKDRMLLPLELDGQSAMAILDTGAQYTTIGSDLAARVGVTEAVMMSDPVIAQHGAGAESVPSYLHRFARLAIGPALALGPRLPVLPSDVGIGDALVGQDFLSGRRVWLSFASSRMYVSLLPDESASAR